MIGSRSRGARRDRIRLRRTGRKPQDREGAGKVWSSRLFWKFFIAYCVLFLAQTVAVVGLIRSWQRDSLLAGELRQLENTARLAAGVAPEALAAGDRPKLQAWASRMGGETGLRLTFISATGEVLADTNEDAVGKRDVALSSDVQAALQAADGFGQALFTLDPQEPPRQAVSLRIGSQRSPTGVVRVLTSLAETEKQVAASQTRIVAIALVSFLGLVAATYVMMARIVQPVTQVIDGAKAIAGGRYDQQVRISTRDELGALGASFNLMARELQIRIEELKSRGEQLAVVLGSMVEGVIAVDGKERILFANEAAGVFFDFSPHRALGRPFWEAVRNPVVQKAVQEALRGVDPARRQEFEVVRTRRMVALHATRLPGAPCPGAVLVLHDVTELRRLENLRQEFVANVSHELKTPLTSIKAYAETLLGGALEDPEHNVAFVKRIEEQAERLHQLIVDVLSLARIEQNPAGLELTSLSLTEAAEECVARHLASAEAKEVRLTVETPASLDVRAEREGLRTILDNLVNNALKYTPPGGQVFVRCREEQQMAAVEVSDTGIGIAPEHQGRIFERFYRADAARSRELGGTGLGLSIVKHLVQAFDGAVSVTSQVGRGSTFVVHLPRMPAAVAPTASAS